MTSGARCAIAGANDAIRLVVPRHGLLQHSTDVLRPVRWVQPARCEIFRHRGRLSTSSDTCIAPGAWTGLRA